MLVVEGAQFDPGHVPQAHDGAVRVGADDNLTKLRRRLEPPLGADRVRLLNTLWRWRRAYLAGGDPVAIPAATLDGIVERIVSGGTLRRAYLGVSSQPVELQELLRRGLGIQQATGLMLLGLEPDAPAERAGLLLGDILLSIGGRTIEDGEALQMALGPAAISAPTTVRIIRGGQVRDVTIIPAPRPD